MSSSISICRTLNLWEKSFPVPRSSETATIWSVAASRLVRLRKIFLPTKFSCPTFRGSGPRSSTRSIPSARHRPAQLNRFLINKTAGSPKFSTALDPMHFTEGTEPGPQQSQSGQGVGLRDPGADLGALCEKRFSSEKSVIAAG